MFSLPTRSAVILTVIAAAALSGCSGQATTQSQSSNASPTASASASTPICTEGTECGSEEPDGFPSTESSGGIDPQAIWDDYPDDGKRYTCEAWKKSTPSDPVVGPNLRGLFSVIIARQKLGWGPPSTSMEFTTTKIRIGYPTVPSPRPTTICHRMRT